MTMDVETESLLRASLTELFRANGANASDALDELGWSEVVAEDPAAWSLLFEEQGRVGVASALLDLVVLDALGLPAGCAPVVYPEPHAAITSLLSVAGERAEMRGVVLSAEATEATALVAVGDGGVVVLAASGLERIPVDGIDPESGWMLMSGSAAILRRPANEAGPALATARRALAAELIGIGAAILDLAVEHVSVREQFGRPIGSYQSVRHRLAEAHVALQGARSVLAAAWSDGSDWSAATAKAVAGSAHAGIARHALQVCGAMGLSWEFGLHPLVKRGFALDGLLGSARSIAREQGEGILSGEEPARIGTPATTP